MTWAKRLSLAGAFLAAFTVTASAVFLFGTRLWGAYHPWGIAFWAYLWYASDNPIVSRWLEIGGAAGVLLPAIFGAGLWWRTRHVTAWSLRRPPAATDVLPAPLRSPTDNHGHARWAEASELMRVFSGPNSVHGGIVVGECYDPAEDMGPFDPRDRATWGLGGTAPLLIDPCENGSTHAMMVAGSGQYKTVSCVATLLTWRTSSVILDPSLELSPMLEVDRRRMGHRVYTLAPDRAQVVGFNVLEWIDPGSVTAEMDIGAVVEWIAGSNPRSDATAEFFAKRSKSMLTALLSHILYDPNCAPEEKTLKTLRAALSVPEGELRKTLRAIHENSPSHLARSEAAGFTELTEETYSGVVANAQESTRWLATARFADLVSGNSFKADDLADGGTDVFIAIPLKVLMSTPGLARCVVGALMNAVYERDGDVHGRVLFMLDEAARLGRMKILEIARDCGRKFGITLLMVMQSAGQLEEIWDKDGARAWEEAVSWRSYAGIKDINTAEELSKHIGRFGALGWSENAGSHGRGLERKSRSSGTTYSEFARPLMSADEICNDMRGDAQIVLSKNCRAARTGRAIYFRRPELNARVAQNRFARAGARS